MPVGKARAAHLTQLYKTASEARKLGDFLTSTTIAYGIIAGLSYLPPKESEKPPKNIREMLKIDKKEHSKGMQGKQQQHYSSLISLQRAFLGWRPTCSAWRSSTSRRYPSM